ncbi:MAG: hypothetical protein JXA14_07765 [Anaerolineae bacterium]|nr:hypothetical protein [Anaerolineae bacterium]
MNDVTKRFLGVSAYAIAMAYLEAAVVVYLRALLGLTDITAVDVSLGPYGLVEIGREVATAVMLAAVGWIAGRRGRERWAYGLFAFGLWDIAYYVWLKVLIDWPASLLGWDLLFLIPLPWWGPVLAPALIAVLICVAAVLAVVRMEHGQRLGITPLRLASVLGGALLALYVFMADAIHALLSGPVDWDALRPTPFHWPLFLVALALMALPTLLATYPVRQCATSRVCAMPE